MCHAYHFLYGVDVTVFRYFTVYGPAGRPDMVMFRLAQWIREGRPVILNGDGEQSRGFTYLDDIAQGTILVSDRSYQIINLVGMNPSRSIPHPNDGELTGQKPYRTETCPSCRYASQSGRCPESRSC
jgi:nucleoside-diphosphate-sugar epimerase